MTSEKYQASTSGRVQASQLADAVTEGIITREQRDRLAAFWAKDPSQPSAAFSVSRVDAEEVRFVRGFHDVFIAIGIVVFLFGMIYGLGNVASSEIVAAVSALAVWSMSELFARKMRLALPSFILALCFTPLFFVASVGLLTGDHFWSGTRGGGFIAPPAGDLILPAVAALAGAVLHYRRFKVPAGVIAVTAAGFALAASVLDAAAPGVLETHIIWFILFAGIASFTLAMWFDSRDLKRSTVNSDKAFWLHLLAAPLIVHSVLMVTTGNGEGAQYPLLVIVLFMLVAFVAIVVDRRALLVSGLGYFGIAIAALMTQADVSNETSLAITLVLLGFFILLLGSAWRFVRHWIVLPVSTTQIMKYVPSID